MNVPHSHSIDELFALLSRCAEDETADRQPLLSYAAEVVDLGNKQTAELLARLNQFLNETVDDSGRVVRAELVSTLFGFATSKNDSDWPGRDSIDAMRQLYRFSPYESVLRNQVLNLIVRSGTEEAQSVWADLLSSDPPGHPESIAVAFSPLMSAGSSLSLPLLTRLIDEATSHSVVAAPIYDLANFMFRSDQIATHPAASRSGQIVELLGALAGRLSQIEEGRLPDSVPPEQIAAQISNSVALLVSLIDTVALLGDQSAIGKLNQASQLRHRRIQVEAAAALARLGDDQGKGKLIAATEEPVIRLRAIAYAKELGLESEISLEQTGPIAVAESHLAMWLAEPSQMGLAPSEISLLDGRKLFWPSYEEPVECFLFRFQYGMAEDSYRGIGISGPLTHAFTADLDHLPIEDCYSAFAGWQTVSEEIFVVPIDRAESLVAGELAKLRQQLQSQAIDDAEQRAASGFFGEYQLVATGKRDGTVGTLIVGDQQSDWVESGSAERPIDWMLALDIWRGRKLLSSFNAGFTTISQ